MANIGKNQIYRLDKFLPNLNNAIKISNLLKVSIDYLVGKQDKNDFTFLKFYSVDFINKLENLLEESRITKTKFYLDLHLSTDAFTRWKRGDKTEFRNFNLDS